MCFDLNIALLFYKSLVINEQYSLSFHATLFCYLVITKKFSNFVIEKTVEADTYYSLSNSKVELTPFLIFRGLFVFPVIHFAAKSFIFFFVFRSIIENYSAK